MGNSSTTYLQLESSSHKNMCKGVQVYDLSRNKATQQPLYDLNNLIFNKF